MNIIYEILSGSHAYGTNTPESDRDVRGIWLPKMEEYLGMKDPEEIRDNTEDTVYFPIRKFFLLAKACNPNILEWLWMPAHCVLKIAPEGALIVKNRDLFVSAKRIYDAFRGYAQSEFLAVSSVNKKTGAKRKRDIEKFGFSPKNAMNMVRLMEEGIEYLETGGITLPRSNADYLLAIKRGEVSYEEIAGRYNELNNRMVDAYGESKVQKNNDYDKINDLLVNIIKETR